MNKYLKRENFNSQAISFNVRNTVHNSFVIVLFNNIQMVRGLFWLDSVEIINELIYADFVLKKAEGVCK